MPLNNAERTNSFLFRHEAEMRSSVIGNVHYYINLSLDENSYCGTVRARFDVMQATKEHLFLEYAGKRIIELIFDDDVILDLTEIWQHHRLMLPAQWSLKPASHTISMRFENVYDNTGCGLFAYCEDSHIYIYSCFASNYAHTVFPCFDQPDIKGVFQLKVACPKDWQVVSNENPQSIVALEETRQWIFQPTPPISTYLFCINAGHWYKHEAVSSYKQIQTDYYCRQSCAKRVGFNIEQIQQLIDFGLEFYERHFGIDFPFSKYDQIFCPEFNFSGMENPGAVELTENYLFFENPSTNRMTQRALTVVHELSHMWFGDLVTMKWWKDIWLNEAFAVLISYVCIDEIKKVREMPFDDVWCKLLSYKESGYEQDIQTYTHAVEVPVDEASESQENFDSITYSKGAAVLHQLVSIIGWTDFYKALHVYFKKYQWRNADMNDLFEIVDAQSRERLQVTYPAFSIKRWVQEWISTPSLNEIMASIEPNMQVRIHQQPLSVQCNTIRQHCFLLSAYVVAEGEIHKLTDTVFIDSEMMIIDMNRHGTVRSLATKNVELAAVILNENDQGYFFNLFDRKSLLFFLSNYEVCFSNDLMRKNFIKTLHQSCIRGYSSSQKLFDCYIRLIQQQQTKEIFMYLLQAINSMLDYISLEERRQYSSRIFDILYLYMAQQLQEEEPCNEILQMIKEYIGGFAETAEQVRLIYLWLVQKSPHFPQSFKAGSYPLSSFLMKYFKQPNLFDEEDTMIYDKYWQLYVRNINTAKYYRRIQDGSLLTLEQVQDCFEQWVQPDGLSSCSLYELEYFMQGMNNEYSPNYDEFEFLYFQYLQRFLLTKNKQFIKRLFKKLHPKQGNISLHLQILEDLKVQYLVCNDIDKMFYVKQIQQKIDFLEIKVQIQLSASPDKPIKSNKTSGFKIELLC